MTIAAGDRVPDARVWTTPNESATVAEIAAEGPMLLLFYLFESSRRPRRTAPSIPRRSH